MATSALHIAFQRTRVSGAQFETMVREEAYRIWRHKIYQGRREQRDWYDAHRELANPATDQIFPRDPRYPSVKIRAKQLYDERKAGHALQDWIEAEHIVSDRYVIAD